MTSETFWPIVGLATYLAFGVILWRYIKDEAAPEGFVQAQVVLMAVLCVLFWAPILFVMILLGKRASKRKSGKPRS